MNLRPGWSLLLLLAAACGGDGGGDEGPTLQKVSGDAQAGYAGNFAPRRVTVRVLQNGAPVANQAVTFAVTTGGGSVSGATVNTDASGYATLGGWRFGGAGSQAVTASSGGAEATFTAQGTTPPASAYNIEVRYAGTPPEQAVQDAFAAAAARWRDIIVGDVGDIVLTGSDVIQGVDVDTGIPGVGVITCTPELSNQTIDDLVIYADIRPIDGTTGSNILGFALPSIVRQNNIPVAGCMVFDEDNLDQVIASGQLGDLILHEMGHVIGFGTIWEDEDLLTGGCPAGIPQPFFTGESGRNAFWGALAAAFPDSIVPVEGGEDLSSCNDGTRDSHWREGVFNAELMTGFIEATGTNPLSAITASSLRDLGYVVNDAQSDAYTVPVPIPGMAARRSATAMKIVEPRIKLRPTVLH